MDADEEETATAQVFLLGKTYLSNDENLHNEDDPIVHMAAGDRHSILVTASGRVLAFGDNNAGQLGLGHRNPTAKISRIKCLSFEHVAERVRLVACGRESSLVATNAGSLFAFGSNSHGQLGFAPDVVAAAHPVPMQIWHSRSSECWKQIAMGAEHSCALTEEGVVYVWGSNDDGQCGHSRKYGLLATPTRLDLGCAIATVSCGYYHTALIDGVGRLLLFGNNDDGQLGRSKAERSIGSFHISMPESVIAVACGNQHTIVLTGTGRVYVCGQGNRGQLGLGTRSLAARYFELVAENLPPHITALAAGEGHTALVGSTGDLYLFGDGKHGKLNCDTVRNEFRPCFAEKLREYYVTNVACGGCQTIVLAQPRYALYEASMSKSRHQFSPSSARVRRSFTDMSDGHLTTLSPNLSYELVTGEVSPSEIRDLQTMTDVEDVQLLQSGKTTRSVTFAHNQSNTNTRSPRHSTKAAEEPSPITSGSSESSPVATVAKTDGQDDESGSSTTISRSSSASSDDDENGAMPAGSIDGLHHSFRSPRLLRLDDELVHTSKSGFGFFSRMFGGRTSHNPLKTDQQVSRTCVTM